MFKNKFFYLTTTIVIASLLIISISSNSILVNTGKMRIYHLVLGILIIGIGGVLFVFIIDKLLAPKSTKKVKQNQNSKTKVNIPETNPNKNTQNNNKMSSENKKTIDNNNTNKDRADDKDK